MKNFYELHSKKLSYTYKIRCISSIYLNVEIKSFRLKYTKIGDIYKILFRSLLFIPQFKISLNLYAFSLVFNI